MAKDDTLLLDFFRLIVVVDDGVVESNRSLVGSGVWEDVSFGAPLLRLVVVGLMV